MTEDPRAVDVRALAVRDHYYGHLDALRGIAALIVALMHVNWANHLTATPFIHAGAIFVDFFFVLSGVVISHVYPRIEGPAGLRLFLRRRLARLYPLHLAMLLIMAVAFLAVRFAMPGMWDRMAQLPQMRHLVPKFFAALFLLNAHSLTDGDAFNVPSWSIGAEMTAYLVYALATVVALRRRTMVFAVLALLSLVFLFCMRMSLFDYHDQWGFVRGVMGFSLGCVVYAVWLEADPRPTPSWLLALASLAVCAAVARLGVPELVKRVFTLFYPLLFAPLLFLFIRPAPAAAARLCAAPLRLLGRLSYGIYMIHFLLRWAFGAVLLLVFHRSYSDTGIAVPLWAGDGLVAAYLAVLLALAYLSYAYFEDPIRRRFHGA